MSKLISCFSLLSPVQNENRSVTQIESSTTKTQSPKEILLRLAKLILGPNKSGNYQLATIIMAKANFLQE